MIGQVAQNFFGSIYFFNELNTNVFNFIISQRKNES